MGNIFQTEFLQMFEFQSKQEIQNLLELSIFHQRSLPFALEIKN